MRDGTPEQMFKMEPRLDFLPAYRDEEGRWFPCAINVDIGNIHDETLTPPVLPRFTLSETFRELAEAAGGCLDGVEAGKFVHDLRYGDDDDGR